MNFGARQKDQGDVSWRVFWRGDGVMTECKGFAKPKEKRKDSEEEMQKEEKGKARQRLELLSSSCRPSPKS